MRLEIKFADTSCCRNFQTVYSDGTLGSNIRIPVCNIDWAIDLWKAATGEIDVKRLDVE